MSTPPCPVCGKPLEEIYKELRAKHPKAKPIYVCRNNGNCKSWFCDACNTWHPWGTCCAVEMVHDMRRGSDKAFIREAATVLEQAVATNANHPITEEKRQ